MLDTDFSLFFATDLHGSDKCFRKFVNAAKFYDANVLFLGGDLAGKAVVSLWRESGRWMVVDQQGQLRQLSEVEATEFERAARNAGHYVSAKSPAELASLTPQEKDAEFRSLATERLCEWLELADSRLRGSGVTLFAIPGNDDPIDFDRIFAEYPFIHYVHERVVAANSGLSILGLGGSNITPWHTYREMTEGEIEEKLSSLGALLPNGANTIADIHVPPFGSLLDSAPMLDKNLKVQIGPGGVKTIPVGSKAVRRFIEQTQPMLALFGHIHEGRGATKIGASLCVNPGSQYSTGNLLGFWARIKRNRVHDWQLTEG
jgi:Icc-related predicted phosphoesterase